MLFGYLDALAGDMIVPDWEALYQANDTGWDRAGVSPALTYWLEQQIISVRQYPRVLLPGCGRGYEVLNLARLGFDVTAIDVAPTAIATLNKALQMEELRAKTICGDLFDVLPNQGFDVIYEQTCLCALPLNQREAYEQQLSQWLQRDGVLLLSMMQTGEQGGPPFHCDWADMRRLFSDQRWLWQQHEPFIVPRWHSSPRFELGFILRRI